MPEERRISPAVVIAGGLGLGLAAVGGLYALSRAWAAPPTVYTCPHCGAEFDTEEELLAHIELEHPELPPPALATLYGVVTDAETGAPLANVSVQLWSPDGAELLLSTTTDSGGYYSMANISPGSYLIRFQKEGYEAVVSDIVLVEGNNELNVQLTQVAKAEFYVPPEMTKKLLDGTILDMYWDCKVWCPITNNGDAPGTHRVHVWDSVGNIDYEFNVTLQPGETYTWNHHQWIDFRRLSRYTVWLQGDWEENNYSKATFP